MTLDKEAMHGRRLARHCRRITSVPTVIALSFGLCIFSVCIIISKILPSATAALSRLRTGPAPSPSSSDDAWHAPAQTDINNLTAVLGSNGVYGFIYNSSETPDAQYGAYNWCNMPHVRATEYIKPDDEFELQYVEVIHRHHKRTPYASNAFPVEPYRWDCDDTALYHYGEPSNGDLHAAAAHHQGFSSPVNPFIPSGWIGSCQFPQLTAGGLRDSWQHGADLYGVYHDLLGFLPGRDDDFRSKVKYRVTNNLITSQVAGMVINGMWGVTGHFPLLVEAQGVDSLEPQYSCPVGADLFKSIRSTSNPAWREHLVRAASLYSILDNTSGVPPDDVGFHASFDHYYDNLSARQCHGKPLPCKLVDGVNSTNCVSQELADQVYRLGQWEYSQLYRDSSDSLAASTLSFGVWIGEVTAHLSQVMAGQTDVLYYHNVAHDGSMSRLLSILQLDQMVWPGMGAEIILELYKKQQPQATQPAAPITDPIGMSAHGQYYVRVLWGGRVLSSSSPILGRLDMVPAETLLAYLDGLVGEDAKDVRGKCQGDTPPERQS